MPPQSVIPAQSDSAALRFARIAYIAAAVVLPILIVPVAWFPFQLSKISTALFLLALAAILMGIQVWHTRTFTFVRTPVSYIVIAFVGAVALSAALSQNMLLSLVGDGAEADTLFFAVALFAFFVFATMLLRKASAFASFAVALLVAALATLLFQVLQLLFGPNLFGMSAFGLISSNTVGSWNDFGVFAAFITIFSFCLVDLASATAVFASTFRRMLAWLVLVLSLGLLAFVNLDVTWWVIAAVAVCAAAASWQLSQSSSAGPDVASPSILKRLPWASLLAFVVAVVFIVWGSVLGPKLSQFSGLEEFEARPSPATTVEIVRSTYDQNALTTIFGSGPNTFSEQWLLHKPARINLDQLWSVDFNRGFGAIPSMFVTLGLLGGFVTLLLPLVAGVGVARMIMRRRASAETLSIAATAGLSAIALFALAALYPVTQLPFIFAFILLGVFVGMMHTEMSPMKVWGGVNLPRFTAIAVALILIAIPLCLAGLSGQRLLGNVHMGRALKAAGENDLAAAQRQAERSIAIHRSDDALRLRANIAIAQAQAVVSRTEGTQEERSADLQRALSDALAYGQAAITEAPRDYTNWLTVARIYESLIPANVEGAYQNAENYYVEAIRRSPRNPGLYLAAARMEAAGGNEQALRDAVAQALTLKPNYTEAVLLIVELEIAKNNLPGAIAAAQAAVQTNPQNAGVWFELGLLELNAGRAAESAAAFESALRLIPDYANAKYFLGLAYYQLGRLADAAGIFTELSAANPENKEVAGILENLRAGRTPFFGMQTATGTPTTPNNPPISEQ